MKMNDFVHLHVHSEYSLLDGACKIKELPDMVLSVGQNAVALTDHGVMSGTIDFYRHCLKKGVKPIIGCEVYVAPFSRFDKTSRQNYHLVLLCKNNIGYKNLLKIVSDAHINGFYNRPRCDITTLKTYSEGLIALSGCISGELPRKLLNGDYKGAVETALQYKDIFGADNYYIELQNHRLREQLEVLPLLRKISAETNIPAVATNDAHYLKAEDADMQRVLMAISTNSVVDKNFGFQTDEFYIKTKEEMSSFFKRDELARTVEIADRCNVDFEFGVTRLPLFNKKDVFNNDEYFYNEVFKGLKERYGENLNAVISERAEYEISIIRRMGFVDYFLIVADFIGFARKNNIPVGPGRGSGVGSICAYALKITSIDPLRFGLLFERFLNPERISMPDFDVDFCYLRRGEVIEYVTNKYGKEHVAQIITFGTMAARSAIRDAARTMGLSYNKADKIAKLFPPSFHSDIKDSLLNKKEIKELYDTDKETAILIDTALKIEGMPRHPSVHAAGIVITREPVTDYVPLQKSGEDIITQYTMGHLEELGLLKMDFLGLRYLTIISKTAKAVNINIDAIDENDSNIYKMLSNGGTAGVFQFESEGMTNVLSRLLPSSMEDLIATISLYRPGPMQSIPKYIENRHNPHKITYKHPILREILEVTYGCIVYQEQVMEICRRLAGFSYGRADLVRRAMSKKKLDVMENERLNFIKGSVENGVSETAANEIFNELSGFATYAFNKSHAAAYANLAYQTAYLRHYFYREYMTEIMTSVLDNHSKLLEYKADIEKNGLKLIPPDVNNSFKGFSVEKKGIRYGLLAVKNLGRTLIDNIVRERQKRPFISLSDFCERMYHDINKRGVEALIKSGAFDSFSHNRRSMLMSYEKIMDSLGSIKSRSFSGQLSLFDNDGGFSESFEIINVEEFPPQSLLQMEKESIGFFVSGHPLDKYSQYIDINNFKTIGIILNDTEKNLKDGAGIKFFGMLISLKRHVTKKNAIMCFSEFEDTGGAIEVIIFPDLYEKTALILKTEEIYAVYGTLSISDEKPKVLAKRIELANNIECKVFDTLYIIIHSVDNELISKVYECAREFQGQDKIRLCFSKTKEVKKIAGLNGVKITNNLLSRLTKLCGKDNIVLK